MRALLAAGADKVSINTAAVRDAGARAARAAAPGARRPSSSPSTRRGTPSGDGWEVFVHGGRTATGLDAVRWAEEVARLGAGEILLTSMDRDGTLSGYDVALTRAVSDAVPVPVIASGGVGTLEHLRAGLVEGRASAVLAASIFHDGTHSIARGEGVPRATQACPVRPLERRAA